VTAVIGLFSCPSFFEANLLWVFLIGWKQGLSQSQMKALMLGEAATTIEVTIGALPLHLACVFIPHLVPFSFQPLPALPLPQPAASATAKSTSPSPSSACTTAILQAKL